MNYRVIEVRVKSRALMRLSRRDLGLVSMLGLTISLGCGASDNSSRSSGAAQGGAGGVHTSSATSSSSGASEFGRTGGSGNPRSGTTTAQPSTSFEIQDPESDAPCEPEPEDGTWSELRLESGTQWHLAFAQQRAILTCVDDDKLFARVSDDSGRSWSAAKRIDSDESMADRLGTRVLIAPDGSSAFAYWQSTGGARWVSRYDASHGWGAPVQVGKPSGSTEPFPDNQLIVLSNGKAVLAHESEDSASGIQYRLFDGTTWDEVKSLPNGQFGGVFLGLNEVPALYTEEADPNRISPARRTLDSTKSWSQPEFIPYEENSGAYQLVPFEGVFGHAARIRRGLGSEGVRISVRESGNWGPDVSLGQSSRNLLDLPRVAEAGNELLAAWSTPIAGTTDESELLFASRSTASAWRSTTIPRGRNLTDVAIAGSQTGAAVLIGTVDRFPESSLTKVFRRSSSGVWYCPRLKKGLGDAVAAANADGTLLVAVLGDDPFATVLRFEPR